MSIERQSLPIQLYVDLPNFTYGGDNNEERGRSMRAAESTMAQCVTIARARGQVIAAYLFSDLEQWLKHLTWLGRRAVELGYIIVHAPRITEGVGEKETVDTCIVRMLSRERVECVRPTLFMLASRDRDFGPLFGDLRNAGHHIEVIHNAQNGTCMLGRNADAEHSFDDAAYTPASNQDGWESKLARFADDNLRYIAEHLPSLRNKQELGSHDKTNVLAMVTLISAIRKNSGGGKHDSTTVISWMNQLLSSIGEQILEQNHARWLVGQAQDSGILVVSGKNTGNHTRFRLEPTHRLVVFVRTELMCEQVQETPHDEMKTIIVNVARDESRAQFAAEMQQPAEAHEREEPPQADAEDELEPELRRDDEAKRTAKQIGDDELRQCLINVLSSPMTHGELAKKMRDSLNVMNRKEAEALLSRVINNSLVMFSCDDQKRRMFSLSDSVRRPLSRPPN